MTTKCLVYSLRLQLFIGFVLWNFIKCNCPFPKQEIINGRYQYNKDYPKIRSNVPEGYLLLIRCLDGYELKGGSGIQCLDGEWYGNVPSCEAMQCSEPPTISNGTYTFTDKYKITIGTQAIYSCNPGYRLSDPSVSRLTCMLDEEDKEETLWAGDIPACQAMKPCSDPGIPKNGARLGACGVQYLRNGTRLGTWCFPGDIVGYYCNEGFELVGEEYEIKCLSSSRWSSPRPLCKPLKKKHCELPPEIPNGVVLMKSGDYALTGEEVQVLCKPGYKLNGTNQYPFCNRSALWEDEFGECIEILCDPPKPLANGNIPELYESNFTDIFPYNFMLTYNCDEGYRLKGGDSWSVCSKDGWSGTTPYCEDILCPDPGVPEHGSRLGRNFTVGADVRFSCFDGYELLGSYKRYCSPNGKWTGELTRCNAPTNYCPNPGIPINGMRKGNRYIDGGDTVEFSCASGFFHSGSTQRTCMPDRTWNGTETKCLGTHDFDSTEEIGRILKHRLDLHFEEWFWEYNRLVIARGMMDNKMFIWPPRLIMYFAFDVSGSIGKENFKKGIEFAKAIVRKIGVSEDGDRVGALAFDSGTYNIFLPMDYIHTDDVLDALDHIEYLSGGLYPTSVLEMMIDNIQLVESQHDFYKRKKNTVLFLITDGKSNMGGRLEYEADYLKNVMNVEIFCIGITGDVRAETLYQIASTSSKYGGEERPNVFLLKNSERLNWLIQYINNGTLDYGQCGLGMESKMTINKGKMMGGKGSVEPWPWMATLYFSDPTKKAANPELVCGGSIINKNFILTAAHCLFERDNETLEYRKRSAEEIIVKLGLVELRSRTFFLRFQVENIYIHDDYMPGNSYDNDIALLKLDRPIKYDRYMRPVCLPPAVWPEDDNYPLYKPNEYGWVADFGHEYEEGIYGKNERLKLPEEFKELSLTIQPNAKCRSSLGKEEKSFTERMFCAGDPLSEKGTCKGDSGSPFMQPHMNSQGQIYWTQVGIVSWGVGCENEDSYGYYTNVQVFRLWIDEKTKEIVSKQDEE